MEHLGKVNYLMIEGEEEILPKLIIQTIFYLIKYWEQEFLMLNNEKYSEGDLIY